MGHLDIPWKSEIEGEGWGPVERLNPYFLGHVYGDNCIGHNHLIVLIAELWLEKGFPQEAAFADFDFFLAEGQDLKHPFLVNGFWLGAANQDLDHHVRWSLKPGDFSQAAKAAAVNGILNRLFGGTGVVLTVLIDPHSYFDDKPS